MKDPRWRALPDCLTQHGLSDSPTDGAWATYSVRDSAGNPIGSVTYGHGEQLRFGPVSYAFETNPSPSGADVDSLTTCITEIFGPNGVSSPYVTKYTKTTAATNTPTDPSWYAMLDCFTARGLTVRSLRGSDRAIVTAVGSVEDDHLGHGSGEVLVGPMSYTLDSSPPPAPASERSFIACVHDAFGG